MKSIFTWTACMMASLVLSAQQEVDIFNFSKTAIGGTARNMGVGGVMGSVGGDNSSVINNPGGLGFFQKGEISLSPSLIFSNSKSTYLNETNQDFKNRFVFTNAAIVFTKKSRNTVLKASSFAIGVNRIQNFNNSTYFSALNENNSFGEALARQLTQDIAKAGGPPRYSNGQLKNEEYNYYGYRQLNAFDAFVLDYDTGSKSAYAVTYGKNTQSGYRTSTGGINEIGFNWGGNFNSKIYWGMGINVDLLHYNQLTSFTEEDYQQTNSPGFLSYTTTDNLEVRGTGVNLKTGVIIKPNDYLRLSTFIHTPTYYRVSEEYSNELKSKFSGNDYTANSPISRFTYDMYTPWKFGLGATGVFRKSGFLAVEYELVDYSSASVDYDGFKQEQSRINNLISTNYNLSHVLKIGGEFSYESFRVRAGYNHKTSSFNKLIAPAGAEEVVNSFTGGVGYRGDQFGVDLAFVRSIYSNYQNIYTSAGGESLGAINKNQFSQIVLTTVFKF